MIQYVNKLRLASACAALSAMLAGCGSNPSSSLPTLTSVNPLNTGKLGFAVGTANLFGLATGLNVVSTYRQSGGLSNVLVDTPTITGPFKLPGAQADSGTGIDSYSTLPAGPSAQEVALGEILGTSQNVHPGTPACDQTTACSEPSATGANVSVSPNTTTFGQSGGVFTDGISPGNYTNGGVASSYVPYTEPLYTAALPAAAAADVFVPFGGPPLFRGDKNGLGLRDGLFNIGAGVVGIPLGISTFADVVVSAGTYKLSLQVPTGFSGSTETFGTVASTATMSTTGTLPTIVAPTFTTDGAGGGSFTIAALPVGVTEELVEIVDSGDGGTNCQGEVGAAAFPVYYTILVKAPGTYTLPDTIGPNTTITSGVSDITPSESICTAAANTTANGATTVGDSYSVQAIGADYPLYESLYPGNTSQSPTLAGANGQADITISAVVGPTASLSRSRSPHVRSRI